MPKRTTHIFTSEDLQDGPKIEYRPTENIQVSDDVKRRYEERHATETYRAGDYKCKMCGTFAVSLRDDAEAVVPLSTLPKRRTDGASILDREKYEKAADSLTVEKSDVKLIKREKGVERQYRFACRECGIWLGYWPQDGDRVRLTYILPGALISAQVRSRRELEQHPPMCIAPHVFDDERPGCRINVYVDLDKTRTGVMYINDENVAIELQVSFKSGRSAAAAVALIARTLGVDAKSIIVERGVTPRLKVLYIREVQPADALLALEDALQEHLEGAEPK